MLWKPHPFPIVLQHSQGDMVLVGSQEMRLHKLVLKERKTLFHIWFSFLTAFPGTCEQFALLFCHMEPIL